MSTQKNLITLCIATVFTLGLAACGGGGGGGSSPVTMMDDTTTTTPPTTIVGQTIPAGAKIPLPEGVELPNLTVTAVMGQTIPYEGIGTFTCASAEGCSVEVVDNVITTTGDIVVDSVADDSVDALIYAALNTEPVELNELQTAQAAAADAATAAMTAAGNAATSATAAVDAGENLATLQTGETSSSMATKASEQAALAHAAYMAAKTASDAAEAATDVTAAVEEKVAAEAALANAMAAETMAREYGQMAEDAAVVELKIDGLRKSVGADTAIMADAGSSQVVTGVAPDTQTEITGLIKTMNPTTSVAAVEGKPFEEAMPDETPAVVGVAHVQAVAMRMLTIGKTLDSDDDMARLMLVTHYAGTNSVKVYAKEADADDNDPGDLTGTVTSDGRIQTVGVGDDTVDNVFVTLKSVGTYYLATPVADAPGAMLNMLDNTDQVGAKAEAMEVFSYLDDKSTEVTTDDETVYVVLESSGQTTGEDAASTVVYQHVDITVLGQPDEDAAEGAPAATMGVTANIPQATAYKHIHFGVWAALGAAKKDGSQAPSDLGVGFVQNWSGEGMTVVDMPNNGGATYNGNWVATVRGADPDGDGDIALLNGPATVAANFSKAEVTATLSRLATLEGAIDTNTFSGTKATVMDGDPNGLDSDGKFTGSFSGGFFGDAAAEAGGVFDFTSDDAADGEFRGAFGGDRVPEPE